MKAKPLVAFLLVKGKKVLAEVRKASDDFGANAVWIPGGHVEKGETEDQAFLREIKEELNVLPLNYFRLCKLPWKKQGKNYSVQYFVCKKWTGKIKSKEASKLIWIKPKEINKLDEKVDRKAFKKTLGKQAIITCLDSAIL